MNKTCGGETGGYPVDCYESATWTVVKDDTDIQIGACDRHVGQVAQSLTGMAGCTKVSIHLIGGGE